MSSKIERMERMIVKTLVEDALDAGCCVMLHDGGEIVASTQVWEGRTKESATNIIMRAIRETDMETLILRRGHKRLGTVLLVYGNDGHDVIADHTANDEMDKIVSGASALADKLAELEDVA